MIVIGNKNMCIYMQDPKGTKLDLTDELNQNDKLEYITEPHITYTPCYVLVKITDYEKRINKNLTL